MKKKLWLFPLFLCTFFLLLSSCQPSAPSVPSSTGSQNQVPPIPPGTPLPATSATCGNSILEGTEQCDDGNQITTDDCLASCLIATCGDGVVRTGQEECDDGNRTDSDTCTNACRNSVVIGVASPTPITQIRCGNGILESGEVCDDTNTTNGDGCSSTCTLEQVAGGTTNLNTPIVVNDAGNTISRDPALTSFLIPLSRQANLLTVNNLAVRNREGNLLPAQFEILSRWGTYDDTQVPIRFAYAFVRSVPPLGQQVTWQVTNETPAPTRPAGINLQDTNGNWVITTGPSRFTIQHRQNGLNFFEGLSRVETQTAPGIFQTVSEITGSGVAGFLMQQNGDKATAFNSPWSLEVERPGPEVVTIAAKGYYVNAAGQGDANGDGQIDLGYTIRLHFYAGSTAVRVEHTYYHYDVAGFGAANADNVTTINRSWMRIPLSSVPTNIEARGDTTLHNLVGTASLRLEQLKRSPTESQIRYQITGGVTENGVRARQPFLSLVVPTGRVIATIARLAEREPQGLRWRDQGGQFLDIDFTSSPMQVGGARGIWSVAVVDFGFTGSNVGARATELQLLAERPLLGRPDVAYLNSTRTIGPYATTDQGRFARFFTLMQEIHDRTRFHLQACRVTGIQAWPDLPRDLCADDVDAVNTVIVDGNPVTTDFATVSFFEASDNNYWNWSKPGLDEFFRTGRNDLVYDFSLGEAVTLAETLAIRTDPLQFQTDRFAIGPSGTTGLAPCYGSARGFGNDYREGLNNRRDNCPADYTYDKTLKLAYLATGDRRFVDYFELAGTHARNVFQQGGNSIPERVDPFLELALFRLAEQRLELIANAAEFSKTPTVSSELTTSLRTFVDFMLGRVLIDGHSCYMEGSGFNSAVALGRCDGNQAWMHNTSSDWVSRVTRLLNHQALRDWFIQFGNRGVQNWTYINSTTEFPDISNARVNPPDGTPANEGWRTQYRCTVVNNTTVGSCNKTTNLSGENEDRFYLDGILAFFNALGQVLHISQDNGANPDPNRLCQWLPAAYENFLNQSGEREIGNPTDPLDDIYSNGDIINRAVWGKESGQAYAFSAEAIGALQQCR